MQRAENWSQPRSRHGENASIAQGQVDRQLVFGSFRHCTCVERRACDHLEYRRNEVDALAVDQNAEIEFEPVYTGPVPKFRRYFTVGTHEIDWKIGGDLDIPTGRAQR